MCIVQAPSTSNIIAQYSNHPREKIAKTKLTNSRSNNKTISCKTHFLRNILREKTLRNTKNGNKLNPNNFSFQVVANLLQ